MRRSVFRLPGSSADIMPTSKGEVLQIGTFTLGTLFWGSLTTFGKRDDYDNMSTVWSGLR